MRIYNTDVRNVIGISRVAFMNETKNKRGYVTKI